MKEWKIALSFALGVILTAAFFVIKDTRKAPPETSAPATKPSFVAPEMRPDGWRSFNVVRPTIVNEEQVDTYYLPPGQNLVVPSLMSDYSFVVIRNNIGNEYLFPKDYYGVIGSFENDVLSGKFYNDGQGGVWLQAYFVEKEEPFFSARLTAHGENEETVESLIEELGSLKVSEQYLSAELGEIPPRRFFTPNTTDASGKYRYYLPPGYISQPEDPGWSWSSWKKPTGEQICVALEGLHGDPCQFSTSGATCANTGCELLNFVFYLTRSGSLEVTELLQKAQGGGGMGPRFVYGADHPWIYYSASFSADDNKFARNVLDLLYMVESIERTY